MKPVEFAQTPPLPSYLVAFAVGPFDSVDAGMARPGAPIRSWPPKGAPPRPRTAAEMTPAHPRRARGLLRPPLPLPQARPDRGPATSTPGAMENAGADHLRRPHPARRPQGGHPAQQRRATRPVAAHEMAHQWFGDLVTWRWWDDLWLNESFATWMGRKIAGSRSEPALGRWPRCREVRSG